MHSTGSVGLVLKKRDKSPSSSECRFVSDCRMNSRACTPPVNSLNTWPEPAPNAPSFFT